MINTKSVILPLNNLGKHTIFITREMGRTGSFFFKGFINIFTLPIQFSKIIQQIYFIGLKSVFVICLTGAFTGMVLGLQGYYTLSKFGSEGLLGTAVALSLIRELGPVLTAIMIIARAGSAIAAEIGIMRISEQIDALDTMDIDPIRFLASPRIAASLVSFPLLTAMFNVIGIWGGYLSGSLLMGLNKGVYFARVESGVSMDDLIGCGIKSIIFSLIVATICCYQGYYTHTRKEGHGAKAVGFATTSAVVISCVLVLISNYVMTSFLM
jgi:phospholipid/cholesterol/gamma-HCH transport system permease protein